MQTITINKNSLLPIVQENKNKHDAILSAAISGYWVKVEEVLNEKLEKVKRQEKIDSYLNLAYPTDYSEEYNSVIRMLELSADENITLTAKEFDSLVRNQWSWRNSFLTSYSGYAGITATTGAYVF